MGRVPCIVSGLLSLPEKQNQTKITPNHHSTIREISHLVSSWCFLERHWSSELEIGTPVLLEELVQGHTEGTHQRGRWIPGLLPLPISCFPLSIKHILLCSQFLSETYVSTPEEIRFPFYNCVYMCVSVWISGNCKLLDVGTGNCTPILHRTEQ